jgi:WD40 repeat protein
MKKKIFLILILLNASFVEAQEVRLGLPVGHKGVIQLVRYSPDGKKVISLSNNSNISELIVWDIRSGIPIFNLEFDWKYNNISFHPKNEELFMVSFCEPNSLLINYNIGQCIDSINYGQNAQWNNDGDMIASAYQDSLIVKNSITREVVMTFLDNLSYIVSHEWSNDSRLIMIESEEELNAEKNKRLWLLKTYSMVTGNCIAEIKDTINNYVSSFTTLLM